MADSVRSASESVDLTPRRGHRAALVSVSIKAWPASKEDRSATQEVVENHGAQRGAGRFTKRLVPRDCPQYKAIKTAESSARHAHMRLTVPWSDDGARMLPLANHGEYMRVMQEHEETFWARVREFLVVYPAIREAAKDMLGTLHHDAEYPDVETLSQRFDFAVHFSPLQVAGTDTRHADFRTVGLAPNLEEVYADIQEGLERQFRESNEAAMRNVFQRVLEPIQLMASRLGDPDARVYESMVQGVRGLVDIIPDLNLTHDPYLEQVRQRIADRLTQADAALLRRDEAARARVAAEASALATEIQERAAPRRRLRSLVPVAAQEAPASSGGDNSPVEQVAPPAPAVPADSTPAPEVEEVHS